MKVFVVFKKQDFEIKNAYSLVDERILPNIPPETIHAKKPVEDKLYATKELEDLRDSLV